jgi:L-alanine-DL-glutamate epimerase-like enolase superfamily enzyme
MGRELRYGTELWTLDEPFVIAGLVQRDTQLIVVEIGEQGHVGRGETERDDLLAPGRPNVLEELERVRAAIESGASREDLLTLMPPGPARCALDCALWDLESRIAQKPVWGLAGLPAPRPVTTAYTLRAAHAPEMADDARRNTGRPLLKLKLDGARAGECVDAVRRAAPRATLIADANGSISAELLVEVMEACERNGVALLEQPLPRGSDAALCGIAHPIAICADESFLDRSSLREVAGRYEMVNVKLDKAGGLTEALLSIAAARREGLRIMVGCMLGTSLAMAPALLLASQAEYLDIDGPLMLGRDRIGGLRYQGSTVLPAEAGFWGWSE